MPASPYSMMSAYGVNLTPPNPIKYSVPSNPGDIKSVMTSVNQAQNDANTANNDRYKQQLGVLTGAYGTGGEQLSQGYTSALNDLSGSLANNNTVFSNEQSRAIQDANKASAAATNSGIARGLGNTTIQNSMQDQVQRAKNDALAQVAANKATSDNAVYKNISDIHQNQGNALSGLSVNGGQTISNTIGARNDVGPNISDYASLVAQAAQAQNSQGHSTITNVDPIPINSPIRTGGSSSSSGGGIGASMGSYGTGGSTGSGGATDTGGAQYFGPGYGSNDNGPGSPGGGYFDKLPGGNGGPATAPPPTPPQAPDTAPTGGGDPTDPGQGIYDGQNHLIAIKYKDGRIVSMNQGTA